MSAYVLTGVAGFIGSRVAELLLEAGHEVYGVDNMNHAYDIRLKEYRLGKLLKREGFHFQQWDISEKEIIEKLDAWLPAEVAGVINLAAWAGTRRSLSNPWIYIETNMTGVLNMMELCRQHDIPQICGGFLLQRLWKFG